MSAYVKFEMPKEMAEQAYELIELARESGKIRKGANEVTKLVERGQAKFVIMAADVQPEEVLLHMPLLCQEKGIPYAYVPSKDELGKSSGLQVKTAAVAVLDPGKGKAVLEDLSSKVAKLISG